MGHPRSGTHYISALISMNFLDDPDYLKIYGSHVLPRITPDPHMAYIHIWRDFEGVAKSLYILRERFGLKVADYETFLKTPYKDMWAPMEPDGIVTHVRTLSDRAKYLGADDFFKEVELTPIAFWNFYNRLWTTFRKKQSNVLSVKYDDVVEDFPGAMDRIGKMLHSDVGRFKNINQKVGWWK